MRKCIEDENERAKGELAQVATPSAHLHTAGLSPLRSPQQPPGLCLGYYLTYSKHALSTC